MLRVEFHLHTSFSRDSRMSVDTVIRSCLQHGINCLFVTDHDQIDGVKEVQARAPFPVYLAEEITTSEGEMIDYFLRDRVAPHQTPEETIRQIRAQGGLVSIPHPFDRLRHARMPLTALSRILDHVDMLEVFNARNVFPSDDAQALAYAREHNKRMIVASDAHSRWEVGRSFVELPDFVDAQGLLASLQHSTLHKRRSFFAVHAITKWNKATKKRPHATDLRA